MTDFEVKFSDNMFVYAAEYAEYPSNLKVTIPETFLDKKSGSTQEVKLAKGSNNIFLNENPPSLSNSITSKNYITLPVVGSIGKVNAGTRLLAQFIGNCPFNGVIVARC